MTLTTTSGAPRETKWFYERARGQYADDQAKLSPTGQKAFKAEHPKPQMFTKTDLAKFENVWDDHPKWVNLGAQKNFARYALRVGREWAKSPDGFNEFYFKRAIARALIFRASEKLVSAQPWYNGGYRANIVAYSLAILSEITQRQKKSIDFLKVWNAQGIDAILENALTVVSRAVNDDIVQPPQGISNISEWCKRDACWARLLGKVEEIEKLLPDEFRDALLSFEDKAVEVRTARKTQKVDNGIEAQRRVLEIPAAHWSRIQSALSAKRLLSPKEIGVLNIAAQMPSKIPTELQCDVLLAIADKAHAEGITIG